MHYLLLTCPKNLLFGAEMMDNTVVLKQEKLLSVPNAKVVEIIILIIDQVSLCLIPSIETYQ